MLFSSNYIINKSKANTTYKTNNNYSLYKKKKSTIPRKQAHEIYISFFRLLLISCFKSSWQFSPGQDGLFSDNYSFRKFIIKNKLIIISDIKFFSNYYYYYYLFR